MYSTFYIHDWQRRRVWHLQQLRGILLNCWNMLSWCLPWRVRADMAKLMFASRWCRKENLFYRHPVSPHHSYVSLHVRKLVFVPYDTIMNHCILSIQKISRDPSMSEIFALARKSAFTVRPEKCNIRRWSIGKSITTNLHRSDASLKCRVVVR